MKNGKNRKNSADPLRKSQRLSTVSTIGLILLMGVYLVMTIATSAKLADQTEIISEHPFEVVIAAGDVKLYISEMNMRTERLQRHHSDEDEAIAKSALETLHTQLEEPLAQLEELYLGDPGDVEALNEALTRLGTGQDAYLAFVSPETTADTVETYVEEYLQPLYDQALSSAATIITVAQEKKVGYGQTADSLRKNTLLGSAILMSLMVAVLLLSQHVLRRQRRELAQRSSLFDNLSLSIDDTFLIRDGRTGAIRYTALNMERVLGSTVKAAGKLYQGLKQEDAEEFKRVVQDPQFASPYEKLVEYTKPDGEKCWLLVRIYRTEDRNAPQLITVFSDRTEEITSRQALQDAMLSAERANTAKSDFLSRMSHEIRTPLNAIIGMTTIAAASVKDPARVEDCLAKINFSSKHLLMLIGDVLDMSKIESSKMTLQKEPFDIFEIVNGFVSTVYPQAKAKQIEFTERMEGFAEHSVYIGDSLRLSQILLNLSSNAVKFTEPGGAIRLEVSRIACKNTMDILRFTVADTGIGMTEETAARIFQPFEQADASISSRYGGTGLGMSITKNLVAMMNGKISIDSKPGAGTTFTVDLPFARGEEHMEEPDFAALRLGALIVDDEQQVCVQTAGLLEKIKIRAQWRQSGAEALELIREAHRSNRDFDLCLVDWKMPDMDGVELTRRIRREVGEDIPIVMISAYDITEIEREARDAGVNGFLPKPLYRSSVYTAIKEALAGNRRPAEKQESGQPLQGLGLLVAEDNEMNREIVRTLLEMNGAKVRCAVNGKEALELFLASSPGGYNAILMDVQMPVMNGHEASRKIRASGHPEALKIPIIATTANAFSDDISAALAAGMDAHISKPLDIRQLCKVLNDCIRKSKETGKGKEEDSRE